MRIDNSVPFYNFDTLKASAVAERIFAPAQPEVSYYGSGIIVEISQQARDAYNQSKLQAPEGTKETTPIGEVEGCQTCKNRRYVDKSSDPSVSYQTPTKISPEQAAGKVMAHEREHVTNEQARAQREDRRVVSQTVSLSTSICPECGRVYISGGVTRTTTVNNKETELNTENKNAEL